jgi:beta-glucosidase
VATFVLTDTRVKLNDFLPPGLEDNWTIKLVGTLNVPVSGPFEFGLAVSGRAKLFVNGEETIDNWTRQRPGEFFYGQGTAEEKAVVELDKDTPVHIEVVYTNTPSPNRYDEGPEQAEAQPALMRGVRLGGCPKIDADRAIAEAAALAKESDMVVFVGGLTPEWESEGFDRPTLSLPGLQDETIAALARANPNTVVVLQAVCISLALSALY